LRRARRHRRPGRLPLRRRRRVHHRAVHRRRWRHVQDQLIRGPGRPSEEIMVDQRRTLLGKTGPSVFPVALGGMAMSGVYGPSDDAESTATIREAIDRGVTLLDTGDFYGMGHNELLIRRAIEGLRGRVQLSVKFGALRGPDGAWLGFDARPVAVKNFAAYSLKRLRVDCIDI